MKAKVLLNALVALLGAVALTAVAGGGAKKGEELSQEHKELMEQLDTNGDGKISRAEASAAPELARKFRDLDRDDNSVLEVAEFARFEVTEEEESGY